MLGRLIRVEGDRRLTADSREQTGIGQRLVTQMYFPGDPLLAFDPIYNCVPDPQAKARMVSAFDWETTQNEYALGYRFDIVLRGRKQTVWE